MMHVEVENPQILQPQRGKGHIFIVVLQAIGDVLQEQIHVITVKILDIVLRSAVVISLRSKRNMQFKCQMLLS